LEDELRALEDEIARNPTRAPVVPGGRGARKRRRPDPFLIARLLVEAGARCVTVAYGFWDTHGDNFNWLRKYLPVFDQGQS
jgi:hypothetical protein